MQAIRRAIQHLAPQCGGLGENRFFVESKNPAIGEGLCCINAGGASSAGCEKVRPVSVFKRRRSPTEVILVCVHCYCKYGIYYRDLAEMMQERGVMVDHTTIFRWVQRYAPEVEKRVRWYQGYRSPSWQVDETCVRVGSAWRYLFRAIEEAGRPIDFMLSDRRNTCVAHRFLGKALKTMRNWPSVSITTDKLGSYRKAIRRLQCSGHLAEGATHSTSKYLNNIVDADHGGLKQVIRPTRGFQTMKTAYATIKGFEIMRTFRRGHCVLREPGAAGEVSFVNKLFG